MVAGNAVHPDRGQPGAAENVAAPNHHPHFGAGTLDLDDFVGQTANDVRVDAVVGFTHQGFAGKFEQDTVEFRHGAHGISG